MLSSQPPSKSNQNPKSKDEQTLQHYAFNLCTSCNERIKLPFSLATVVKSDERWEYLAESHVAEE
jgi:hypothetical protein